MTRRRAGTGRRGRRWRRCPGGAGSPGVPTTAAWGAGMLTLGRERAVRTSGFGWTPAAGRSTRWLAYTLAALKGMSTRLRTRVWKSLPESSACQTDRNDQPRAIPEAAPTVQYTVGFGHPGFDVRARAHCTRAHPCPHVPSADADLVNSDKCPRPTTRRCPRSPPREHFDGRNFLRCYSKGSAGRYVQAAGAARVRSALKQGDHRAARACMMCR